MKISVIIPAYNEEKYIARCLESLMIQTKKPDEILVIDNNSTDKTLEIVRKYPVRIVHEQKQGMIEARNRGFNEAAGDIIARCDADTILPSIWIESIHTIFQNPRVDAATGPLIYYDLPMHGPLAVCLYFFVMKLMTGKNMLSGPNMIITKKIWLQIKNEVCLDDKKVHEDIDLSFHIAKHQGHILQDKSLTIQSSGRRIKNNPYSFFIEYPIRLLKMISTHH